MSRLKCVARWRRSSVLLGGIFNSKAIVSTLNRGSKTCGGRTCLGAAHGQEERTSRREFLFLSMTQPSHHQASMHTAASQVRRVFCKVHRSQPLHYPVVGPLGDLSRGNVVLLDTTDKGCLWHGSPLKEPTELFKFGCTSSDGRRRRQFGSKLLSRRTWIALLMLRWCRTLPTFRESKSSWRTGKMYNNKCQITID